jgi:DNA-directed RNA polymerase subunit RPC12/RpoP
MGVKCEYCGTDNGITHYSGKVCKRCGKELGRIKFRFIDELSSKQEVFNG